MSDVESKVRARLRDLADRVDVPIGDIEMPRPLLRSAKLRRARSAGLAVVVAAALITGSITAIRLSAPPPRPIHHPTISSTGEIAFVLHVQGSDYLYTMASDGTHQQRLVPVRTCCASISPDGDRLMIGVAAPGGRTTVATLDPDGSGYAVIPLPSDTLNLAPGMWSPDGTRIALEGWDVADPSRNGVYTVTVDGGDLVRVTTAPGGRRDIPLAYAPDGSRILFFRGADQALYVAGTDGKGVVELSPPGAAVTTNFGSPASWSPDGRMVAFAAHLPGANSGRSAVFEIDPAGASLHRITPWGRGTTSARYSPDGQWIVFDKEHGPPLAPYRHDLFLVHPDGTAVHALTSVATNQAFGACCAVWSPDGTRLLFVAGGYLFIVGVDGTGLKQLTNTTEPEGTYTWGRSPTTGS
jgi:TolB protein